MGIGKDYYDDCTKIIKQLEKHYQVEFDLCVYNVQRVYKRIYDLWCDYSDEEMSAGFMNVTKNEVNYFIKWLEKNNVKI